MPLSEDDLMSRATATVWQLDRLKEPDKIRVVADALRSAVQRARADERRETMALMYTKESEE